MTVNALLPGLPSAILSARGFFFAPAPTLAPPRLVPSFATVSPPVGGAGQIPPLNLRFHARDPTPVAPDVCCRDLIPPTRWRNLIHFSKKPPIGYASGRRVLRGAWHGRIYTEQSDFPFRECLLLRGGACGGSLRWVSAFRSVCTVHIVGVLLRNGHGCASMLCRTYGVQPGHGRTSRSVGLPSWRVPHRTFLWSAWGSRGVSMGVWVYLARLSSFLRRCRNL